MKKRGSGKNNLTKAPTTRFRSGIVARKVVRSSPPRQLGTRPRPPRVAKLDCPPVTTTKTTPLSNNPIYPPTLRMN